ncbi:hypothetical protein ELQ92_12850, partial [Labedella populi]
MYECRLAYTGAPGPGGRDQPVAGSRARDFVTYVHSTCPGPLTWGTPLGVLMRQGPVSMFWWWPQQRRTPLSEDAVVDVGSAAVSPGDDVVDFAPSGGNPAAGDDAAAVSSDDRAALSRVEAALHGRQGQDPPVRTEGLELEPAGVDESFDRCDGNGCVESVDGSDTVRVG